jgi:hypothetical protein
MIRKTFTANFACFDDALEWGRFNGWTLQSTEPRENGGVRAHFLC